MYLRFGFIKYGNYWDAENCIRAFWHRGYEAKFARVGLLPSCSAFAYLTLVVAISQRSPEGVGR